MPPYSEYLNRGFNNPDELANERKVQLARISARRGRDVLVIAANVENSKAPVALSPQDLLSVADQLDQLPGNPGIDIILETPGGSGEAAEDIVKLLRGKYQSVAIIVPGTAKSAGTIMAMAGDEILLDPVSCLGPIDAQIFWQGKVFSADALLRGFEKIKKEVDDKKALNRAYVPMLQAISPGELQHAENALDFAKELVRDWLATYKFQNWNVHSSDGRPVTAEDKRARAAQIASELCDHSRWKTHARSIKLDDLVAMRLQVTDLRDDPELHDAVRRYYVLLKMTFETNIFKLFETPTSQILRFEQVQGVVAPPQNAAMAEFDVTCGACKAVMKVQANFVPDVALKPGNIPFPADNKLQCP
jgi:hypothetical protein